MSDAYTFRPRRKAAAIYCNNGEYTWSVQVDKEHEKKPEPRLVKAVKAAEVAFWKVYEPTRGRKSDRP